jgi:hypothetical protein
MTLRRGYIGDPTMTVLLVIPLNEVGSPPSPLFKLKMTLWVVRAVL